ncbi:MAG: RsmB/NOP family class I SAM-dependent RNA methyltransferase [Chloroflexota bacterium]
MSAFPPDFVERMNRLLGEDAPSFWKALEGQPPQKGVRINTLKITVDEFKPMMNTTLSPLPWTDIGFLVEGEDLGSHPYHAAGLYYLQEPSAMAVAEILNPQPGELVLDIAAAPGGKTTHLASKMRNQGALVANDPHGGRVQALARNLERWGTHHTVITQERPQRLADHLGPIFDRVLVDAPCSGEGTFRKDPGEIKKWTPNYVQRCAAVQNEILWYAAQLVRPGGYLVYSTCTFSPEENEGAVKHLLQARSDFKIVPITKMPGLSPGNPDWVNGPRSLENTVRIWPHKAPGEGHFVALMRRTQEGSRHPETFKATSQPLTQKRAAYRDFVNETFNKELLPALAAPEGRHLTLYGDRLYAAPEQMPFVEGLRVRHWGWWLGTFNKDRFTPSHALAMGLPSPCFQDRLDFRPHDQELMRYMRGLTIKSNGEDRWVAVTVDGYPLGWGKRKQDNLHSRFPRWLSQI